jgi:hypothetical protein
VSRVLIIVLAVAYAVLTVGAALAGRWWGLIALLGLGALVVLARRPVLDGPPVTLGDDLARRVRDLLATNRRTEAVRLVRQETGARLMPAARAVDDVRRSRHPGQDVTRPS